jgi:hypothetical protein
VDTVVSGTGKAWVNFNGTGTVAIRASFNVSSITDNGTGDYTINFSTAMSDANYAMSGAAGRSVGDSFVSFANADPTASALRIYSLNSSSAVVDNAHVHVHVHR